jgi:hypothetical protein
MKPTMKLQRLLKIETFEQSVDATKLISAAIFEGVLDDLGAVAEIEPLEMAVNDKGRIVGVEFLLRVPASAFDSVVEGVMSVNGFRRDLTKPGSNVTILHPISEKWVRDDETDMVQQKFSLRAC